LSSDGDRLLKNIDNLDILCADVEQMVAYYHNVLGLPFFYTHEPGSGWAAFDAGNLRIYLVETSAGEHEPRRSAIQSENAPGLELIAFAVDDLDQAQEELNKRGVEWAGEAVQWEHPSGTWYRYRGFYDPEGNLLYITEPHVTEPGTRLGESAGAPTSSHGRYPY
jgi:catechol 2,3-dioxygenase-like lactoylglutathione lyase family enzyme